MTDRPAPRRLRRWRAGGLTLVVALACAMALLAAPPALQSWQEGVFDRLIGLVPARRPQEGPRVVVIDIGTSDDRGEAWGRGASARLAAAVGKARPAAVGWDIVFAGSCGDETANIALAAGLSRAPTALGFLLSSTEAGGPVPHGPVMAMSESVLPQLWAAPGAEMPCPDFARAAASLGSVSLPGDETARVRMVPAAVSAGGQAWPSLAVETLRLALQVPTPLIAETPDGLRLMLSGLPDAPLGPAATLRFRPVPPDARAARTLAAEAVLKGEARDRLAGAIVLIGSSLPQRGGLRPTAADPLYPSVQIAADVTEGLLAGSLPWRPASAGWIEAAAVALGGIVAAGMVLLWPPLRALAGAGLLAGLWSAAMAGVHAGSGRLLDPAGPALAIVAAALAGILWQAATTFRAERALRDRMGQLLPAAVVSRLVDDPSLLRLAGERREVTALFTDLEGFSILTNTLEPEALIALLDRYFTTVSAIVLRHGGMIDKIVGDAVHALFNAPLDQPDHVDAALAAAAEIVAETEALRTELGLGRTRVGIETGPAILGDVGSGARIDYTAHGPSVNLAARLQEAGKQLGPAVIIGPAAARKATRALRPLGETEVRSFGRLALFTLEGPVSPRTAGQGGAG